MHDRHDRYALLYLLLFISPLPHPTCTSVICSCLSSAPVLNLRRRGRLWKASDELKADILPHPSAFVSGLPTPPPWWKWIRCRKRAPILPDTYCIETEDYCCLSELLVGHGVVVVGFDGLSVWGTFQNSRLLKV